MAEITGFTADRMLAIEDASIVDGNVVGDDLILVKHDGTPINAGNVRGETGATGDPLDPPEAWKYVGGGGDAAFANGWINRGGSGAANTGPRPLKFRKKADLYTIEVNGAISGGSNANGVTLFTFPAGYIPAQTEDSLLIADSGLVQVEVNAITGDAKAYSIAGLTAFSSGGIYLDGILFSIV